MRRLRNQELIAGKVTCNIVDANNPCISGRIPLGSVSQSLRLYDTSNTQVAKIHRYIKPDGAIGASGKNDPKRLTIGSVVFHQPREGHTAPELSNKEINTILNKRGLAVLITHIAPYYYQFRYAIEKMRKNYS